VLFVALLAAAIAYGVIMWRRRYRSPEISQARDAATKKLYERPNSD